MSLINSLLDKLSAYLQVKGEKIKLDIIGHVSRLLAHVVAFGFAAIVFIFILIFGSITLGAFLNEVLESTFYGHLIITGFYFLIMLVTLLLLRSGKIQKWMESLFVKLSQNIEDDE